MNQMSIDFSAARARADIGIQRAADAADRKAPSWTETTCEALRKFAAAQSEPFTVEQARDAIAATLPAPSDLRAWGAVTQQAMKRGYIHRLPGRYAPAASSNLSPKALYFSGVYA